MVLHSYKKNLYQFFLNHKQTSMQKMFSISRMVAISLLFLFISCSKKGDGNGTPNPVGEIWPQEWVLTMDFDATFVKYLQISGRLIYRSKVGIDYSLKSLSTEKDCKWLVKKAGEKAGRTMYTFQLASDTDYNWYVVTGGSVLGTLEYQLNVDVDGSTVGSEQAKFFINKVGEKNGKQLITIESVFYPGYFLINTGHTQAANGVLLSKTQAPAQFYKNFVN